MTKISYKKVQEGLKKGKIHLVNGITLKKNKKGELSGCPITALYFYYHSKAINDALQQNNDSEKIIFEWAIDKYGEFFVRGFSNGFDKGPILFYDVSYDDHCFQESLKKKGYFTRRQYHQGQKNGIKIRKHLLLKDQSNG